MFSTCQETVSILYAVIFGAADACVRIDIWSILSALGVFIILVVVAQFVARRLWARLIALPRQDNTNVPDSRPYQDDPTFKDSAIKSTKR